MATRKNPNTIDAQTVLSAPETFETGDVIPLTRLEFRSPDMYLVTQGFELGTPLASGPYTGAKVVGMYATASAFMVEVELPNGDVVTILHRGDGAGVVA